MTSVEDLAANEKYVVSIHNKKADQTVANVDWCIGADRHRVMEAIQELLVMKEKRPDVFNGQILIRAFSEDYTRESEEGRTADGYGQLRSIQDTGGNVPDDRARRDHTLRVEDGDVRSLFFPERFLRDETEEPVGPYIRSLIKEEE